ncbi:SAC3 domain-containing protein 1 isoform X1 [Alosa sapidissima]|uniref:SAC3 domain-containing protein 1 isoform X1 n=2 Tax=Alosa sapidissima TaxID=34773 RepID=UPI001C0A31DF|nr:SAC3 domain-containing protein 1 isoform X1 [Alosa sapidissima]
MVMNREHLSLSPMNGRPNHPRRGRGRTQHGWRPQQEEGEARAGRSELAYQEPQGWGHPQKRRPQGDDRPEPWDRPQQEHWRAQKDKNRPHQNWRQRPEQDRQQSQNWRHRSDQEDRAQPDGTLKPKQDRQNQGWTQQPEQEEVQRPDANPRGTCMAMCPRRELQDREAQCRLHRFEMLAGTEKDRRPKADPARMVKEYSRPAAGKDATQPSDLRPPAVLLKTVCYLIDEIAASPTLQPWTEVYSFVFDRLRSIRQDLIIQRASGAECVAILERTVRLLIYASQRLCGEPLQLYDPKINDTHLQESLSWLLESYGQQENTHTVDDEHAVRDSQVPKGTPKQGDGTHQSQYKNQEEFEALNLLYNLGCARVMQHVLELPARVRSSPAVCLALAVSRAFCERNPVRLLRLAGRLDFLQGCALHRHLLAIRRQLLQLYSHGHSSRNCRYPLGHLASLLALTEPQKAERLCLVHGVAVSGEWVGFNKVDFLETPKEEVRCASTHEKELAMEKKVAHIIHGHV